jgi:hypothetical protein
MLLFRKVCNHPYLFPDMDPFETDERIIHASRYASNTELKLKASYVSSLRPHTLVA